VERLTPLLAAPQDSRHRLTDDPWTRFEPGLKAAWTRRRRLARSFNFVTLFIRADWVKLVMLGWPAPRSGRGR
jgi:hypothetical protein